MHLHIVQGIRQTNPTDVAHFFPFKMDKKIKDQILNIAHDIEDCLNKNRLAAPNPQALARLNFLAANLTGIHHYAGSKARELARKAERFYSARKHSMDGNTPEHLWAEMTFDLLGRIRGVTQEPADVAIDNPDR